jgi:hypothetical protein
MPLDQKALRILFDTNWSASGWNRAPSTDPGDFGYARHLYVRHLDPLYAFFDLIQFETMDRLSPTIEDYAVRTKIIEMAEQEREQTTSRRVYLRSFGRMHRSGVY